MRPPGASGPVPPVLVVGIGSELRSDDAAGRRVAELVAGRQPPRSVEVVTAHQLTPELAEVMTERRLVIVVDASVEVADVTTRPVVAAGTVGGDAGAGAMTHHLDVAAVVRLAALLGEPPQEVTSLAVPAHDLRLGTDLSPATASAVQAAVEHVDRCCAAALGEVAPARWHGPGQAPPTHESG